MAKILSTGYTDTPIDGVSSLTFSRGLVNFGADFRQKSGSGGTDIILTNITCPSDRPEEVRIGYTDVQNVYTGTGIESSVAAPTKRGVSILAKLTEVFTVSDATSPEYRVDLPVSCHLVLKVPSSEFITPEIIENMIGRLLSSLYDTGSSDTSRLRAILRGSLIPADL